MIRGSRLLAKPFSTGLFHKSPRLWHRSVTFLTCQIYQSEVRYGKSDKFRFLFHSRKSTNHWNSYTKQVKKLKKNQINGFFSKTLAQAVLGLPYILMNTQDIFFRERLQHGDLPLPRYLKRIAECVCNPALFIYKYLFENYSEIDNYWNLE